MNLLLASRILNLSRIALVLGFVFLPGPTGRGEAAASVAPLAGHPGNVFLAGEEVAVPAPGAADESAAWELVDYEKRVIREAKTETDRIRIGVLPVGYYELRRSGDPGTKPGSGRVSLAVLASLQEPTPRTSPIGCDLAMSWFYGEESQKRAVANLARLAGLNWVRDRLTWGEVEPERGVFKGGTRYDDSARILAEAGLRVLQVNHSSPGWAGGNGKRFAPDLRDVYRFHREIARRWQEQVEAFEPWNEADIDVFGGHTGAEMASLQKAAFLGLRAGNSRAVACLNVFAGNRRAQHDDLAANEAWPYFDTCNLHHYIGREQYPAWYEGFRAISGGRPLWVTEFSLPVKWSGDEQAKEPDETTLRMQAERVPMAFAASLHEGPQAAFYFILGHYTEGQTQFGIIRRDLTPRPAYVALATVGRLLADAKPLGKLRWDEPGREAYLFAALPDGEAREVLVAWSAREEEWALPVSPVKMYDLLGRSREIQAKLAVGHGPVYAILPPGSAGKLPLHTPPTRPAYRPGQPSPVVLQASWPAERVALGKSAYRISSEKAENIPVFVYNFSAETATGKLSVTGPTGWKLTFPTKVTLAAQERKEVALKIDCSGHAAAPSETIIIRGEFGQAGRPVLSFRLQPEPARLPPGVESPIAGAGDAAKWQTEISIGSTLRLSSRESGGILVEGKMAGDDRWIYPRLDLTSAQRPGAEVTALHFKLTALDGRAHYRVIFVEEGGGSFVGEPVAQPGVGETIEVAVVLEDAVLGTGWSPPDANGRLDIERIRAIKVGCNTPENLVRYGFGDLRWVKR